MNTCQTCRWWAPNINGKPRIGKVFACLNEKLNQPSFEIAERPDCAGPDEGGLAIDSTPRETTDGKA